MTEFKVKVTDDFDKEDDFNYAVVRFDLGNITITFGEPYVIKNDDLLKCSEALTNSKITASIGGGGNSHWSFSVCDETPKLEIDIGGSGGDLYSTIRLTKEQGQFIIDELLKIVKL